MYFIPKVLKFFLFSGKTRWQVFANQIGKEYFFLRKKLPSFVTYKNILTNPLKIMKKLIFVFALLIGVGFSSFAQTAPVTAEQKADEVVAKMKNDLSLTEDQVPKVKGITLQRITKVTEAVKKYGGDKNRIQAANKLTFSEWENQLKGILTVEQFNKYVESKSQY